MRVGMQHILLHSTNKLFVWIEQKKQKEKTGKETYNGKSWE